MCPPHNWLPRRTVSGPTHRSAPTESIAMFISPGRAGGDRAPPLLVDRGAQQRAAEDASLYGCTTGGAQQRADVPKAWLPPTKFRAEIWGVSHRHRPLRKYEKEEKPPRPPWPVAQSEASAPRLQGTGGNHGRDHPQSVQQPRTIPQSPSGRQLPLHKGAFPCGGRGKGRTPPGHWDSQQRQTGRDRARPLQKGGEYAEG